MGKKNWYKLDNSAKIMPSTTTHLNTNVFRLVCTLKEDVDSKILQEALDNLLAKVEELGAKKGCLKSSSALAIQILSASSLLVLVLRKKH